MRDSALVKCKACGLVAAYPMPNPREMDLYNADYWRNAHSHDPEGHSPLEEAFKSGMGQVRSKLFLDYSECHSIVLKSVLEIGPGDGAFAKCLIPQIAGCNYFAVESDSSMHSQLDAAGIHVLSLDEVHQMPPGSVDAVVLSHILEHVGNPKDVLVEAVRMLRSGGLLYIDVPNRDDLHKSIDEPHVLFFDRKSMNYLLQSMPVRNVSIRNFGVSLSVLKRGTSAPRRILSQAQNASLRLGFTLWTGRRSGLENVETSLQRAVLRPLKPQVESREPAWWLRVYATRV